MAASSSTENKNLVPIEEKAMQYYLYPPAIAQYEDVIANAKLFMDILGKFHAAMGTKFKIPIVGGKDLDLHRLFMEVTSRGGIKRVLEEKKWREVTNCFSFPPSATNASFILRKYYMSLIHHFEQVYYFKAKAWTPVPTDTWQSTKSTLTSTSGMNKAILPLPEIQMAPSKQHTSPSPEIQATSAKRQRTTDEHALTKDSPESSIGLPVTGIIDGKFESGYLCTVRIGGEQLQGVLYQTPSCETSKYDGLVPQLGTMDATQASTVVRCRRRRRKKSEIRKRDPAHPKPNRSGYNFFFAEQHARLKLLHTGKDRGISRMIGEHWNKLTESEKAVYQEKAVEDKERYRTEMQHYRESFRRGEAVSNAVNVTSPQQYYMVDTNMMLVENTENEGGSFHRAPENELTSGYCDNDKSSFEGEEEKTTGKDSNLGTPLAVEMGAENAELEKDVGLAKIERLGRELLEETELKQKEEELLFGGHKKTFKLDDHQSFLDGSIQQKSTSVQENEPLKMADDINDENKTQPADNQEKVSVKFGGIVENGPLVNNEEMQMENPVGVQEREVVTSENIVGNKPEAFHQKDFVYISENLEKDPRVSEGGVQNASSSVEEKAEQKTEEDYVKDPTI
ncbi:hypothetical protein OSB04_028064 [Centaurea solstitialis]|uniref:Uncharacterized protein n=1 Tax=Centaurea solstitialis TaxID=347529 RepID=A0AA38SFS9_9ASTR|nr:hypothetical protein OSB04_028064 [Centaurea solstitialis]